ncbi:hypothetical protein AArcCO_2438 [Halalkaliarchaeum sp. AArc-CO]|nr:hypothetical protein AArcCO_2438 [Halalkaliarchaeum sp. AArc-CO]
MGNSVHTRSPVRRAPRVLPSLLATPMAVLLSASLVFGPTTVTDDLPVDPISPDVGCRLTSADQEIQ